MSKKATSKWIFFNNNFRHKLEPNLFGDMGLNSGCYFRIIIILYFSPPHLSHCYKIHFLQHYHKIVKKNTERACFLSFDHVKTCDGYWKTKIEITNTKRHMAGTLTLSGFDSLFDFFPQIMYENWWWKFSWLGQTLGVLIGFWLGFKGFFIASGYLS